MKPAVVVVVVVTLCLHHTFFSSAQACPSTHQLVNSLQQLEKMLADHEASYRQSLRSLRRKISGLLNSTAAIFKSSASCPQLPVPAFGRRLGRVFAVGHEVHFVCTPGYELLGPRRRLCLQTGRWSGQQPACRRRNTTSVSTTPSSLAPPPSASIRTSSVSPSSSPPSSPSTCTSSVSPSSSPPSSPSIRTSSVSPSSSPPPSASIRTSSVSPSSSPPSSPSIRTSSVSPSSSPPSSPSIRPSRCSHLRGSTRCTCPVGFAISGRDNNICTDIDECRVFPLRQPGRLCVHQCINSPGSFRCSCPAGYDLAGDGSSCTDVNECEKQSHDCSTEQVCVNTFGGFQCATVSCPSRKKATYIKTSPVRCEKNPCMQGDKGCLQAPNSISFHFLSVVSNLSTPRVLFRVSAARVLGDTLRFGLLGSRGRGHFSVQRSGRQTGTLLLVTPIKGPTTLEAEVEMSELDRHSVLGRYITKVSLFVSAFDF